MKTQQELLTVQHLLVARSFFWFHPRWLLDFHLQRFISISVIIAVVFTIVIDA